MAYTKTLSTIQNTNAKLIAQSAVSAGITNTYAIAALLAIASKESAFVPQSENLNYSKERILQVWPKTTMPTATAIANNPKALGDKMYGGKFGNGPAEGYMYRGRGFNQITFKSRYKQIGDKIGINLVAQPDLLNNPEVAAKAFIAYFQVELGRHKINPNSFKTQQQALDTIYQANAGKVGKPILDTTGGYAKAASRVDDLLAFVSEHKKETGGGAFFFDNDFARLGLVS